MKFPWQTGWKEERDALLKSQQTDADLEKAKKDLDDLNKSKDENAVDAIGELEKALEDFSDLEGLEKSEKEHKEPDDDNKGGKSDGDEDNEGDEEKDMEKSMETDELEAELVKASEAFEGLTKSIEESTTENREGMELLAKSLGSLTELTIGIGKAVVALSKSQGEQFSQLGKFPAKASGAMFGFEKSRMDDTHTDGNKTSVDEARNILCKALSEGDKIPDGLLARLDNRKDVSCIPAEIAEKYGIKI